MNPAIWFEIYVQDMGRAKHFYESVFRQALTRLNTPDFEMWAFPMAMDKLGASGALVKIHGVPSGGNSTIVYFHCDDCAVEAARAVEFGGRIYRDKMSIGEYGYIALVIDTEGNMIGMHTPPAGPNQL